MGKHNTRGILLSFVVALPLLVAADEPKATQPKSPKAKAAIKKYDRAVEKAAAKAMVTELEIAKKEAMKAENLPEATAIQAVADDAKESLPGSGAGGGGDTAGRPTTVMKGLIGKWVVRYGNGTEREYSITKDGRLTRANGPTVALRKADGGGVLVDFNDGKIERLHLLDGLLVIEHFNPKSDLESGRFEWIGVARAGKD